MKKRFYKIIAPVLITVLLVIYFIVYFIFVLSLLPGILLKLMCALVPLTLAGIAIYVCIQRIEEIRSGEEDDISKY